MLNCRVKGSLAIVCLTFTLRSNEDYGKALAMGIPHRVRDCPRDEREWQKASDRLNCTSGFENTKNKYHCLPAINLTTLIEFCYTRIRLNVVEGQCVFLVEKKKRKPILNNYNCSRFKEGCPDTWYFSDEMYKFPACFEIDPLQHCYKAEASCQPTTRRVNDRESDQLSTTMTLSGSLVVIVVAWKNRRRIRIYLTRKMRSRNHASSSVKEEINSCTDQLRDLLRFYIPPASFPSVIQRETLQLSHLTDTQRNLIMPNSGSYSGNYDDMDISLIYILLRDVCGIQAHKNGWGNKPDFADRSVSANIERLRMKGVKLSLIKKILLAEIGVCTDQLRDLLRFYIPPASFPSVIQRETLQLSHLTDTQRNLIMPDSGAYSGNYDDMDISLLYILLRDVCGIQAHKNGWGNAPDSSDRSVSANIERLRHAGVRDFSSEGISEAECYQIGSVIVAACKDLGKTMEEGNKEEESEHTHYVTVRDEH